MKKRREILNSYANIVRYTGLILILAGVLMLSPLLCLFFYPQENAELWGFAIPATLIMFLGTMSWILFRDRNGQSLNIQQSAVIVVLSWVIVCLFSAWPFMAIQNLNFTQAIFESVSGWTTTGLSVVNVEQSSHLILLWRSIMQWAGGAGLAIIMLATIVGPVGPALGIAEGRSQQLVPQVRQSAKIVMMIYTSYVIVGVVAYNLAGMNIFDAINHTFAAISTGGFSTKTESIGHWNSLSIESVTLSLMILGNLNFLTAYLLLHGKIKSVSKNGEIRLMLLLVPVCSVALFFLVCTSLYPALSKGVRVAVFETITALTTTGFSTVSYNNWNSFGVLLIIVLMLIGGGTCSTAGGIKQYRIYALYKSIIWEIKRFFLPRTAVTENYIWQGEQKDFISDTRIMQIGTFIFLYLATYALGSLVIASTGISLKESLFEFASALGTVGLSVGVTGPQASPVILWTEIFGMLLGRLEFFVIISGILTILFDISKISFTR
ncbi:MAG: TrkH family potassium uptake protein [Sedimentisphaerales bacterium]|nr:TrkH family potassium uptake protein [Sedimentisphaerales bacterium]